MRLPVAERRAVMNAVAKLEAFGDQLGAPHTSQPGQRQPGRDPGTSAQVGAVTLAGAVQAGGGRNGGARRRAGSEHDRRGFDRAVRLAEERLREIRKWQGD
jgi:hypothetical protein